MSKPQGSIAPCSRKAAMCIVRPCVACTVKPERGTAADHLAAALSLVMARRRQPTVAGYLGRVSKTLIYQAVTEAIGKAAEDLHAAIKY